MQQGAAVWKQSYLLFGHGIGLSFLLAATPILLLLVLLGVFRRPAWMAGLITLPVTFFLATIAYHMPSPLAASAAGYGVAFGLFPITWIVFWAIALFRVTAETGQFEIIRSSIGQLTSDPRLQALLIGFAFSGFLEGAAGFGTPVAIAATMLVGLGFSPFRASALCLLANTAPVAFGSIGIPVYTLAGTTGLPLERLSAAVGAICTPVAIFLPLYLVLAVGGVSAMQGIWLPTLLCGAVFGFTQLAISTWIGPQLTDILASLAALLTLVVFLRLRPSQAADGSDEVRMRFRGGSKQPEQPTTSATSKQIVFAWLPYGLLVVCVLLWSWAPLQHELARATVVLRWPLLEGAILRTPPIVAAPAPYRALFTLNWLAAAGTACMVATLLSVLLLRLSPLRFLRILAGVACQLRLPTLTVVAVLAIAFLMNYCGATATLGLGFAATGRMFPFFSALLGWIGVFLTGSDTSSNALFGSLQVVTATRLGFSPVWMAAANSSGGVMGKMISLQTIAIAAAATGLLAGDQVRLFRFTLRHSLALATVTGGITLFYAYVLHLG